MVFLEIESIQGSHQRVQSFQEVSSLLLNKPLSRELDFTFYYLTLTFFQLSNFLIVLCLILILNNMVINENE